MLILIIQHHEFWQTSTPVRLPPQPRCRTLPSLQESPLGSVSCCSQLLPREFQASRPQITLVASRCSRWEINKHSKPGLLFPSDSQLPTHSCLYLLPVNPPHPQRQITTGSPLLALELDENGTTVFCILLLSIHMMSESHQCCDLSALYC